MKAEDAYFQSRAISQSALARMDVCPHSALLYARHRGTRAQTHAMARGELFHAAVERATRQMLTDKEPQMPPDVGREMVESLCDERTDLVVPRHERDALRSMMWNWCEGTRVDPSNPPRTEIDLEVEIEGWKVRGRIDWISIVGTHDAYIQDYKTSLAPASQEDFERSFQVYLYALLVAEMDARIDTFHLAETYPRFLSKRCVACGTYNDGHAEACKDCSDREFDPPSLLRRRVTIGKRELHDFRRSLTSLLHRIAASAESGEWPASPGSHCTTCPAQPECPLPRALRPPEIASEQDATRSAQDLDRMEAEAKRLKSALREWAKENGEIRYGDQELAFTTVITNSTDKEAMARALEGGGVDPRQFQKTSTTSRFQRRKAA